MQGGSRALGELGSVHSRDHPEYSTAARGTSVCPTFTIAHVNATHPSPELDVVSVLSKNLSPVCDATVPTSGRQSSAAAGEGLGREAGRARRVGRHEPLGLELAEVPPVNVADARAPRRLAVALVAPGEQKSSALERPEAGCEGRGEPPRAAQAALWGA